MKLINQILFILTLCLFSCGKKKDKNNNELAAVKPEIIKTVLQPKTKKVQGVFENNFELKTQEYNYKISEPSDDFSLPSFEIPLTFNTKQLFDYSKAIESDNYNLELLFLDEKNEIIEELTISSNFEVVKYYNVFGIDFKKLLENQEGEELTFTFKNSLSKENLELFKKSKKFQLNIIENSPESKLKNALSSFSRSNQISVVILKGKEVTLKYEIQKHDSYWDTGKKIEKVMVGAPVRLMKKLDFIEKVNLTLPFKDKNYSISITKKQVENYTKLKFSEIENNWNESFADKYIYSIKNKNREAYFKKFVRVK